MSPKKTLQNFNVTENLFETTTQIKKKLKEKKKCVAMT